MNKHEWDMVFGFETLLRECVRNMSEYAKQSATAHLPLDGANRLFLGGFFFKQLLKSLNLKLKACPNIEQFKEMIQDGYLVFIYLVFYLFFLSLLSVFSKITIQLRMYMSFVMLL